MNNQANIVQWNCRGLKANYDEIKNILYDELPSIFCLQETKINALDNITFKHYTITNKTVVSPVDGRAIGGVSILIKSCIPHEIIKLKSKLQAVAVRTTLHKTITICSLYIPPKQNVTDRELDSLLGELPSPVLLLGDFNAHSNIWGCKHTDNKGQQVENFLSRHDLCLLNDQSPTYLHPASGSFSSLDLSICSPSIFMDFEWNVWNDQCGSDHYPIGLSINSPLQPDKLPNWQLYKADWNKFELLSAEQLIKDKFQNVENKMEHFTSSLHDIATICVPKTSTVHSHLHKPWFNTNCAKAVKDRAKALRIFKHKPTQENLNLYKIARAKTRRIIKESKRNSWKEYISKLNSRTPAKKVWDMIRKINGKKSSSVGHIKKPNNTKATDIPDIANTLADEFAKNSSSDNYPDQFKRIKHNQEKTKLNFKSNNFEDYNLPFNLQELKESLNKSHDTAVGPDDIHYQFLKHLPDQSLELLLDIFNNIWTTGSFPDGWREATIIPIPKPGKDSTSPSNYRPIALTSCLCKTMERMVNARLVWYLEKNNLITDSQSGFRHFRNTMDHLVSLESNIRDAFVKGEHYVSVFFDLEKAYDTTWKHGILKDMHDMGFKGHMPIFIQNFLNDRTFKVRIGSTYSEIHKQDMGVPQGSILSVTLFSLKINSLTKIVPNGIDKSLFVDDFAIGCKSKNMYSIERQLQLCLNKIQSWADQNGFRFSQSKTVCVHFCNKRKLHLDPVVKLGNHVIPVAEEAKFLGIIFDKKLNFKSHIDYLRTKCQTSLNLLRVVSKMDWGADREVLLRLYRSLIRSKLDYGCIVYGSARKSYLKKLDFIQNQALRTCVGAFRTSPVPSLHVEANELPIQLRREKLSLQFAFKLKANPNNPAYNKTFEPKYSTFYESKPSVIPSFGHRVKDAVNEICPDVENIMKYSVPNIPPWKLKKPHVNISMTEFKKDSTDSAFLKNNFNLLRDVYANYVDIYTDGSKNDDKVAAASVTEGLNVQTRLSNQASIFTAELRAILHALDIVSSKHEQNFIIFSDSLSSLLALKNNNFDNPYVLKIVEVYHKLRERGKDVVFAWCPSHVGIKGNEKADKLAKEALNFLISERRIPHSDLRPHINSFIFDKWKSLWDEEANNKLHFINPSIKLYPYRCRPSRREEVVLTRLRIGHSHLTHGCLLKGEELPRCESCLVPLTIKHILLDCSDYDDLRSFNVQNMQELFEKVNADTILNFVKAANLFYKI